MKTVITSILIILLMTNGALTAQKASDILEGGIKIKSGNRIFLNYEDSVLKYYIAKSLEAPYNFVTLHDSTIFLANDNEIHIFLVPINPLQYSYKDDIKIITDPVDSIAASALNSILTIIEMTESAGFKNTNNLRDSIFNLIDSNISQVFTRLYSENQQKNIASCFKKLKKLSFKDEIKTINELKGIISEIEIIKNHISTTDSILKATRKDFKAFQNVSDVTFVEKYTISIIIKDYEFILNERKKRFENLLNAYNLVKETQLRASKGGDGLPWLIKLMPYEWKKGKISIHTITITEGNQVLSDQKEIVSKEPKKLTDKTYKIRKFNRFVPEVSIGLGYTFFKYNIYGTTSDSTGQQFIDSPTEKNVNNLKISTMINFNLYIPNSHLHPFYQIGVGITSEIPTILTGFGIRTNISGYKIGFSGGIAMTWIRELKTKNIGDEVKGTSDINEDLEYKFSWPPKPYIGLQYNF